MNSVKLRSRTRSPVFDRTTAQMIRAKAAITTQKTMFLTAVFTAPAPLVAARPFSPASLPCPPRPLDAANRPAVIARRVQDMVAM
jgi:hypothetical protein